MCRHLVTDDSVTVRADIW